MPRPLPPSRFENWIEIGGFVLLLAGVFWMAVLPSSLSYPTQETGAMVTTLIGAGITAFFMVRNLRLRHTVKPGHCPTCAYDLRASKKKCPEGGTPFAPEPR